MFIALGFIVLVCSGLCYSQNISRASTLSEDEWKDVLTVTGLQPANGTEALCYVSRPGQGESLLNSTDVEPGSGSGKCSCFCATHYPAAKYAVVTNGQKVCYCAEAIDQLSYAVYNKTICDDRTVESRRAFLLIRSELTEDVCSPGNAASNTLANGVAANLPNGSPNVPTDLAPLSSAPNIHQYLLSKRPSIVSNSTIKNRAEEFINAISKQQTSNPSTMLASNTHSSTIKAGSSPSTISNDVVNKVSNSIKSNSNYDQLVSNVGKTQAETTQEVDKKPAIRSEQAKEYAGALLDSLKLSGSLLS